MKSTMMKRMFLALSFAVVSWTAAAQPENERKAYQIWLDSMTSSSFISMEILLDEMIVEEKKLSTPNLVTSNGTDQLMHQLIGVNMLRRGNFASEPMLRGLNGDRYVMTIDGMRIQSACTDKMDPISSYIEPINMKSLQIHQGTSPMGMGSSTGGNINFLLKKAIFSNESRFVGSIKSSYNTVSNGFSQAMDLNHSMDNWAFRISGTHRKSNNYQDGNNQEVRFSQFEKINYATSISYRQRDLHLLTIDFLGDDAYDVGYPALPMDVSSAKSRMLGLTYIGSQLGPLMEPEMKLYHNFVNHVMDDTQRDSVVMHMDMPGNTHTSGGYIKGDLIRNDKHRVGIQLDAYKSFWHAEMTMYPNEASQSEMFMLTWPDIHRFATGITMHHAWDVSRQASLTSNVRIEQNRTYISSQFGEQQLSVFGKTGMDVRNVTTLSASSTYGYTLNKTNEIRAKIAFGERLPTVSEQYGYYLFNRADGFDYIGDPDLNKEANTQVDISLHSTTKHLQSTLSVFGYRFTNYIIGIYAPEFTAMTPGALGIKWHTNTELAQMVGTEWQLNWQPTKWSQIVSSATFVYGQDFEGKPLPQMPPLKLNITWQQHLGGWIMTPQLIYGAAQHRISEIFNEQTTDAFFLFHLAVGRTLSLLNQSVEVELKGENLFNEAYREHFDVGDILRPGRNISLDLHLKFK